MKHTKVVASSIKDVIKDETVLAWLEISKDLL